MLPLDGPAEIGRAAHAFNQMQRRLRSFVTDWGSTAAERAMPMPCDELVRRPSQRLHRAVDVEASPEVAYRWLTQLRLAPYSYDWLDNLGRRSPRDLVPGTDDLAVGSAS